jgi:hypothetical protein
VVKGADLADDMAVVDVNKDRAENGDDEDAVTGRKALEAGKEVKHVSREATGKRSFIV